MGLKGFTQVRKKWDRLWASRITLSASIIPKILIFLKILYVTIHIIEIRF